jgi:hypothetical protein
MKMKKPNLGPVAVKLSREDANALLLSPDMNYLLAYLIKAGYEIRYGNHLAFRAKGSRNFIRLRSLGVEYSELTLRNRIKANLDFERRLDERLAEAKQEKRENLRVLSAMHLYTTAVKGGYLTPRKKNPERVYCWINDVELDRMLALNKKINEGATLESLRRDFAAKEEAVTQMYDRAEAEKNDLRFALDLREQLEMLFGGVPSQRFSRQQAEAALQRYPVITASNWRNVETLIANCREQTAKAAADLTKAEAELKAAAELFSLAEHVYAGAHVQELVNREQQVRFAETLPSGMIAADEGQRYMPLKR